MPDNHNLVIIYMSSGATTVGRVLNTNKWGVFTSTGLDIESQTNHVEFWMPLPNPPQQ